MIKLLSLFSGIGAFESALVRGGYPYNLVNYCEIDKYASKAYSQIHDVSEELNLWDITKVDEQKLVNKGINLITYGFPCVPAGFLIKTNTGYKPIEGVVSGDYVLTHANVYRKVVRTMSRKTDHIIHIKGVGCADLQVTENHPVYVLRNGVFEFVKARDLSLNDKLVFNINTASEKTDMSDDVLWLMGRFFADGYKENHSLHRVIFCIGKHKTEEFEKHISGMNFVTCHSERNCVEYKLVDDNIESLFAGFVSGSVNKEIPAWIINLPKEQLKQFFDGYYSGDGHNRTDRELSMFCTVSKKMAFGLQDVVIKLFNVVPTLNIRHDKRSKTFNDSYCFQFSPCPKNQTIIDDKICVEIKGITKEYTETEVYNFEVETDNSYTVNNVIVHNCTDISMAGQQKGFYDEEGNKTRSGLFFDALRVIKAVKPSVCIAENVKALTSKKFRKEFDIVLSSLEVAGYNNHVAVLNAKDYGIPQNRERVFIISVRKDIDMCFFEWPEKQELKLRLKDLLEDEVDEKYFCKSERALNTAKALAEKYQNKITEQPVIVESVQKNAMTNNTGISPCLTCRMGESGGNTPMIIDDTQGFETEPRVYDNVVPTLRSQRAGLKVFEPQVLKYERTEYAKTIRNKYENGEIDERRCNMREFTLRIDGLSNTLTTVQKDNLVFEPKVIQVANMDQEVRTRNNPQTGRIYSPEGICPTLTTMQGGGLEPKIIQEGHLVTGGERGRVIPPNGVSPCLSATDYKDPVKIVDGFNTNTDGNAFCLTAHYSRVAPSNFFDCVSGHRATGVIRKLTPRECWRLMGFTDEEFDRASEGISNTQLYKMAGNSIVVNVLEAIFRKLFEQVKL